jgi:hypothetical protein
MGSALAVAIIRGRDSKSEKTADSGVYREAAFVAVKAAMMNGT